jgi:hypothetical protein
MYRSPDTPEAVSRIQQKIWMSKPIEERIRLSLQMIDDARSMQIHGLKMRYPHWTDEDIRIHQLKRMLKNYPSLHWLEPIIQQLELKVKSQNDTTTITTSHEQ